MKLYEFSLMSMEDVIYCDTTVKKKNNDIASTEEVLKYATEQEEYVRIQIVIKTNAEVTKRQFKQLKF